RVKVCRRGWGSPIRSVGRLMTLTIGPLLEPLLLTRDALAVRGLVLGRHRRQRRAFKARAVKARAALLGLHDAGALGEIGDECVDVLARWGEGLGRPLRRRR